ncbi:MAG: M24 family metallopeptidase [Peptococcia bacterium]
MPKLSKVKKWLQDKELDAFLISKPEHCFYLSGFTGTSGCLVVTNSPGKNFLITDFRYKEQAEAQAKGYELVLWEDSFFQTLGELFQQHELKKIGLDQEKITLATYEKLKKDAPKVTFFPLQDPCVELRKIKSVEELKLLKKAIEISDKAFLHILEVIHPGLTEKEVALELEFFMRRLGGTRNAFETIVASENRSALPHGVASTRVIQTGDLVLMDFGTVYQGYHSDLTRTLVLGEPDALQWERYMLILKAQEAVFREIQPGMKACEADALARNLIKEAGYGKNFGHSLGHGVGLEIHEGPSLSPRDETILEPGMVVTVEPGIYISGWGGIRIEDMLVITPGGCERLTKSPQVFKV